MKSISIRERRENGEDEFALFDEREGYSADSISVVKIQKIIDATEHLKIALEKEEALKNVEKHLLKWKLFSN